MTLRKWIFAAESAALLAIFSQFVLPLGPIPLTGQTFAINLLTLIFPRKVALNALFLYLLLGLIGLPVFAGGHGGMATLLGPTGGYLLGFLGQAFFTTTYLKKVPATFSHLFISCLLGSCLTLFGGFLGLFLWLGFPLKKAFLVGVLPFLIPTFITAFLSSFVGKRIKNRFTF